ncbi:putative metalloprotease [Marmoricola sp. OAE513]|uniref:KPN_02809 family neutral zinc metallopeptidase n=1 Tax=Marmoricola sp. OAE513 TaxID=2817894 RepID=UPI001AEB0D27
MRFNPKASSDGGQTSRRTGGGGGGGGIGLPGLGGRGGGRLTIGGVVAAGLLYLVAQLTGVDMSGLTGDGGGDQTGSDVRCTGAEANKSETDDCAISLLTTSIQDYWNTTFAEQGLGSYDRAQTIIFAGGTSSGCGAAQSAMGPFYCPNDARVYIDTDFMDDMLEGDLGAQGGTFALAYVMAHEYGHHVQDLLGYLSRIRTQQGPKSDSVRSELMADCLGGMWAKGAQETRDAEGNTIIEGLTEDDIARAIDAATAVGDDRIQKAGGGRVDSESWTHGSSKQRARWFNIGLEKGSFQACDTFRAGAL